MEKIIRFVLAPICLVIIGAILGVRFYGEAYVTTIQVHHDSLLSKDFFDSPLLQGKVLRGELVAVHDNLGALKFRVKTYNRINSDTIYFFLREKGNSSWDVENAYVVDRFSDKLLYGFGFPPIQYSKGKTYEFELRSESGTMVDSIGFYDGYNAMASQYIFRWETMLARPKVLWFFVGAKSQSLLRDPYSILYYSMFLVPLFLYILLVSIKKKSILYGMEILFFVYMIGIYIILPVRMHQDTIAYIFVLGIITLMLNILLTLHRFTSSHAFVITIGLLIFLEIHIFLGNDLESTRIATGMFYSILLALAVATYELYKEDKRIGTY